jgi:AraC-like DNA-binding protein
MTFYAHQPNFPLDQFIENLIYFDGLTTPHHLERFLPDGNTEVIIDLTEHPQHIYDNETLEEIQTCRYAWVSGVRTQPITIPSGSGSRMLVVAFKKGKAFPFYPVPLSELTDTVVEASLIFGRRFRDLRERLLAAKSAREIFLLVEDFLLQQAGDSIEEDISARCMEYAVSSILQKPSLHCLRQLSDEIGFSQKHFIDLFKQRVGVSPKQYLKIIRFQKAICAIESNKIIRWSQVALDSGYYDQAHFIQDFKYFAGFTPKEYLKRKSSTLNYIPVA